jgi:dipeptidase E
MKLLLISNSTNFGEPYLAWCQTQIEFFCQQNNLDANSRIVFVPFAGVNINGKAYPASYDAYEERVKKVFAKWGFQHLNSIHHVEDKLAAIEQADCIIVGGGNTFHLVAEMHNFNIMDAIAKKVKAGTPYIGWSAGSNVASPTLCTTNDMPIVQPKSFKTLNLIPFQINPHYLDPTPEIDKMVKHGGETRQDRLNEYMAVNQQMTVVGLRESCALWVDGDKMLLRGGKKMIVFQYGKEPYEVEPGDDVSNLLKK